MKKLIASIFIILLSCPAFALELPDRCAHWPSLLKPACHKVNQILSEGRDELYFSGYAWHNRYTYPAEKIETYNETAWGGGIGKGLIDERGNWHSLYAIGFLDSHRHIEPALGYAYQKVFSPHKKIKLGIGFTALVTSRADINHNVPFAGVLPWASLTLHKTTLAATYIPGFHNNGNVLYVLIKQTM